MHSDGDDDEKNLLGGILGGGDNYEELDDPDLHVGVEDSLLPYKHSITSTREKIHSLLCTLRRPLPPYHNDGEEVNISGHLFRERSDKVGHWKWQQVDITSNADGKLFLHYQDSKDQGNGLLPTIFKKRGSTQITTIPFTFIAASSFTKHEKELTSLDFEKNNNGGTVSHKYLKVFSQHQVYTFTARTDDDFDYWDEPIATIQKACLGETEYERREQAAAELEPLLRQRYYKKVSEARDVLRSLSAAGFFDDGVRSAKDKESTLLMLDSETEDSWTSYRVILRARYMYYYISNRKKQHDYRVIPLKYSTVSWREKAEEDGSWVFMVVTPIVTYTLKAKHQVAMEEWVEAIGRSKNNLGKKKAVKLSNYGDAVNLNGDPYEGVKLIEGGSNKSPAQKRKRSKSDGRKNKNQQTPLDAVADKPYLEVVKPSGLGKKTKTYKITKSIVTIGRSSTNDISVSDSRLSREHARIDIVDNKLVFVDLGSKRGSKLNHHMLRGRQVLFADDVIKVGKTLITVRVGNK